MHLNFYKPLSLPKGDSLRLFNPEFISFCRKAPKSLIILSNSIVVSIMLDQLILVIIFS